MKATKFIVGAGALLGIVACFLDWASVEFEGAAESVMAAVPRSGMDNGGPIFIFFLAMPLIAAVIGIIKRFGRGMGVLAFIGGLLATFMAMMKWADISEGGAELAKAQMGSMEVAGGFWLLFLGCTLATVGGLVALIKPEPKALATPGPMAAMGAR